MTDFDYNKLNNLRIHELRDFARTVGVKSPTSLKKEEIIERVLLILSGENAPYVSTTKQGRPAKSQHKMDELVDFFVPKNNSFDSTQGLGDYNLQSDDKWEFFANAPQVSYNENQKGVDIVKGHLDVHKNGYGVVRVKCVSPNDEDVFLHLYSIKTNNLQTGDYLEGEVKLVQDGRPRVMVNILKVNEKPLSETQNRVNFNALPYNELTKEINFNNSSFSQVLKTHATFLEGSRNLVLLEQNVSMQKLEQFVQVFNENEYEVYVLNLNAMPEDKKFSKPNVQLLNVNFNLEDSVIVSCTNLIVEKAKRQLESGKKVVLVINKLSAVIKAINNIETGNYYHELKTNTATQIKNMVMCAKNVSENNNLTLFALDGLNLENNILNFLQFDLGNIFNNVLQIKKH